MTCARDAAHHLRRRDAHREGAHRQRKLLHDLRHVAVYEGADHAHRAAAHRVRRAFVRVRSGFGRADAALDARFLNKPRLRERKQSRDYRGRVATDARYQTRAAHLRAVQLRQPVDGFREKLRRGVVHAVPVFIFFRAAEAEIRRKVDDALASFEPAHGLLRRGAVGQREERDGGRKLRGLLRRNEGHLVIYVAQMRMRRADRRAGLRARNRAYHFEMRMAREDAEQLRSSEAGRAPYCYGNPV